MVGLVLNKSVYELLEYSELDFDEEIVEERRYFGLSEEEEEEVCNGGGMQVEVDHSAFVAMPAHILDVPGQVVRY